MNMKKLFTTLAVGATMALSANAALDFAYTATPAAGTTVPELDKIEIVFTNIFDVDINSESAITLKNGDAPVTIGLSNGDDNRVIVTCAEKQITPGVYTLSFPAGTLGGFDASYDNYLDNPDDITISWTLERDASEFDFSYVADPKSNTVVGSLQQIVLEFPNLSRVECGDIEVSKDGVNLAAGDYAVTSEANVLKIALTETVTEGKVAINIPAGAVTGINGDESQNSPAVIKLNYTVAQPVVYDLTANFNRPTVPDADGVINGDDVQIDAWFFVCDEAGILPDETVTEANVTIREDEGDWVKSGIMEKSYGVAENKSFMKVGIGAPVYNGTYTVTIAKGTFGDAAWLADHNYGRSNDEIELHFIFAGGRGHVEYTLEPTVTPAAGEYPDGADFATVTVKFAEDGIEAVEDAAATLGMEASFQNETVAFVKGADGAYTATFTAPTVPGKYTLTVEQGMFGNAEYFSSNQNNGAASKAINVEYTLQDTSGIKGVNATATSTAGVYNMLGVRLGDDLRDLPAGLYIVNGRKVVKK